MIDTDPFLVGDLPKDALAQAWREGEALAVRRIPPMRRGPSMLMLGPIEDLGPLVSRLIAADALRGMSGITVERHLLAQIQVLLTGAGSTVEAGGDWDWMWTSEQPAACNGEQQVVQLDEESDLDAILALYALANPHAESQPGEGVTDVWLGVRDDSGLAAVGALHRTPAGYPHLTGITVSPEARGGGWGTAVSAALTRRALTIAPMSTLGMYADNDIARAVYDRLGYKVARAWSSRVLI